jgi:hypothetical protein
VSSWSGADSAKLKVKSEKLKENIKKQKAKMAPANTKVFFTVFLCVFVRNIVRCFYFFATF